MATFENDPYPTLEWGDVSVCDDEIPCVMESLCDFNMRTCVLSKGDYFSMLNVNIRSIRKNFVSLQNLLDFVSVKFTFVVVVETWLDCDIDCGFTLENYKSLSLYRNRHGGGITVYYRDHLVIEPLPALTFVMDVVEMLSFRAHVMSQDVIFCCLYRPPAFDVDVFNDFFFDEVCCDLTQGKKLLICGDINIDLFNPHGRRDVKNFIYNCSSLGLYPLIRKPTRFSNQDNYTDCTFSLIDHIWCNFSLGCDCVAGVIDGDVADHLLPYFITTVPAPVSPKSISFRVFSDHNLVKFSNYVSHRSYDDLLLIDDPNSEFDKLFSCLYHDFNRAFPLKTKLISNRRNRLPWITADLRFLIRKKHRLLRQLRRGRILRCSFKLYRNCLNYVLRESKRLYFSKLICERAGNSRETWAVLNDLTGKCNAKPEIILRNETGEALPINDIANKFNTYFASVATDLTAGIDSRGYSVCENINSQLTSCFMYPTNCNEIRNTVRDFLSTNYHKNEIQPKALFSILPFIDYVLVDIFNKCFSRGCYPDVLKRARVVPIFKKGDRNNTGNYRPISTLSIFNKVLEKLIHARLTAYFDSMSVLSNNQFGFRRNLSTCHAVHFLIHNILGGFRNGKYVVCLFLDLRKAFDTVNADLLLEKLERYGIRGKSSALIRSYLTGRSQYVSVDSVDSDRLPVNLGVPQGSVLGPLLFRAFIDDIAKCVPNAITILFADDAAFYVEDREFIAVIRKLEGVISCLSDWLCINKLIPHESKTKIMCLTTRIHPVPPTILFNGVELEWVENFKYLGVIINNKLNFGTHIDEVCQKLSRACGVIYSVSRILPQKTLRVLYHSLFYSHLTQNIILWGGAPEYQTKQVRMLMNRVLRSILGVKFNSSYVPSIPTIEMYRKLDLLVFKDVYDYCLLKYFRNLYFNNEYLFKHFFEQLIPVHHYVTRGLFFNTPRVRLEIEKRSIVFQCIRLLNTLDVKFVDRMSSLSLKKMFKKHAISFY